MNSRERTFLALAHKDSDKIPADFWATPAVFDRLERDTGMSRDQFLDRYDIDLRYIQGPIYAGTPLEPGEDIWGVRRSSVRSGAGGGAEVYSEVFDAPLGRASRIEDIADYPHWPDPGDFDYSVVEKQCDAALEAGRVVVFMGDRLNRVAQLKPAMYLRGAEELFADFVERPDFAAALLERIRRFYLDYLDRTLAAANGKIDIVLTGDDFGAQNGLLLSPGMWREYLKPGFAGYMSLIERRGAASMHHTCGSVVPIVPDMIECGLDALQSIQPEAAGMAAGELKRRFGERLCFHGGISIQRTMPRGAPSDVRAEVKTLAGVFKTGGGYIFCTAHNIQADTPTENIIALVEAYREFGRAR